MSQFNAPKNPPWVRSDNFPVPQLSQPTLHQQMLTPQMSPVVQYQQSPGQQTATVYQAQIALQQQALNMQQTMQQNMQQIANAQQMYSPQINAVAAASVQGRNLNTAAFVQPVVAPNPGNTAPNANSGVASATTATKQRVFTGIVTKVLDTYGFVDEDVFFQLSVVKGSAPVVNDRVLVEAVCLPNMPFKWNATRIQVLPMNDTPRSKKGFVVSSSSNLDRNYTAVPPPVVFPDYDESIRRDSRDRDRDRRRGRSRERNRNKSPAPSHDDERRRRERREREDKEREREKERERARSRSPKKPVQRPQAVKKYRVRVPEFPLDVSNLSVCDLRTRYHTMYVPSDFFRTTPRWQETFPPQQPMTFSRMAQFHVLSKEVDPIFEYADNVEPADADYLFSAKVMLLSVPPRDVMMKSCMQLTEDLDKDDGRTLVHPSRLINCLVGVNTRGKNEIMAVGGPWSPSLDGVDPVNDPNVLIKTAIRTCRALTGVDLTACTHWYRFAEIYYHRSKSTHKGKQVPARVETVVIYVPDVWSAMPSCLEWDGLHLNMKRQLDKKLIEAGKDLTEVPPDDEKVEPTGTNTKEPTHYSQLDTKVMKVSELRDELEARNLSGKGLKFQLLARLTKALKTEQETAELEDKNRSNQSDSSDKEKEREEERRQKEDRDKKKSEQKGRAVIEERYALPESPHVLVFPSRTAKSGKFSCKVMSLSLLLDYSSDVSKEHTFEVSLFAELFNEMLMRDYGMQVYRAILDSPDTDEKEESERRDEKEERDRKSEKREDDKTSEKDKKSDDKEKEKKSDRDKPKEGEKEEGKEKEKEKEKEKDKEKEKEKEKEKDKDKGKERDRDREKEKEKDDDRKSERPTVTNGGEKENSHDTSDNDDDSVSRDNGGSRKDRRDDRRDRKKKDSVPQYTASPELLLAFTYFDVTRYGRISSTHLEDLVHALGLQLSRSQVKKLVGKVVHREYCDYRKLTDLPVGTTRPEIVSEPEGLCLELGNKASLPPFVLCPIEKKEVSSPPAKRSRRSLDKETAPEKPAEGFVYYKGALVNIENLNGQVSRNETERLKTEEKLTELKGENSHLKEKSRKSEEEVKSLQRELKSCKSRLSQALENLNKQVASADVYLSALMDIEERLVPILDTDEIRRLIRIRQSVSGAPSINLVPLTKVEDITRFEEEGEVPGKEEPTDTDSKPLNKDVKKEVEIMDTL